MKSSIKVVFVYDKKGSILNRGTYEGEITDLIKGTNGFISLKDSKDDTLDLKVPVPAVGSLRVFQTINEYMQSIRELHNDVINSTETEFKPVIITQEDEGKINLPLVFNVKNINNWSVFECFNNDDGIFFTHIMPPDNIKYFTQGAYSINDCPIKDKLVNLFNEHFLENLINDYRNKTNDVGLKDYLQEYITGHGMTPIEFVFGISYHIFILPENLSQEETEDIAKFADAVVKSMTEIKKEETEKSETPVDTNDHTDEVEEVTPTEE